MASLCEQGFSINDTIMHLPTKVPSGGMIQARNQLIRDIILSEKDKNNPCYEDYSDHRRFYRFTFGSLFRKPLPGLPNHQPRHTTHAGNLSNLEMG